MNAPTKVALARLTRSPRALVPALGWAFFALAAALVERARPAPAAGHVLLGIFGTVALPLLAFALVGAILGAQGLARATRPLVSFGASAAGVAATTLFVCALISALSCGALSAAVAAIAHGPADPPAGKDALTSLWIGALAGAAYAAYFAFGAAILRSGAGRAILLAVDWVFGGPGTAGLLTPRAHLRSLFGGAGALEMTQRASAAALAVLALGYALLALLFAHRKRNV